MKNTQSNLSSELVEIVLLHGEYYLYFNAVEDVNSFNIRYSFPPIYGNQTPIIMEIVKEDTTADIIDYRIENDKNIPNKIVNFTISAMNKDEQRCLHFYYWVLVKNYNYSNLPNVLPIPKENDLPPETTKWLSSTEVVQKNNIRIKLRAKIMEISTDNLLNLAGKIAKFVKNHRYFLFLIQYRLGLYGPQDAVTTLKRNGECPGRSHLGCALFRADNIPARVILASPNYKFWYEIHYMIEYFSGPKYGWILTEVHQAKTPYEPKNQIIMRICYPEDENNPQTDFINPRMTGIERWFWIDSEFITPYYKDLKEGSKSRMIKENEIFTEKMPGEYAMNITKQVFNKYEYYLAKELSGENLIHFQNAVNYQLKAIDILKDSIDAYGYIYWTNEANKEYDDITDI
ncbi:hypothetical protein AYK24_03470 [Thermoplasmatales archaeon SG8-52-4]|nr:MAG: hypothetical protein AYK24_03470 [Thermoplasmatales archaeon SG8-52-4]